MSRTSYQLRRDAEARWPELYSFLAGYLHQDAVSDYGSQEAAVDQAIKDRNLEQRETVARQWWSWNSSEGKANDIRPAAAALGIADGWFEPSEARAFMNGIYDKLVIAIRNEVGRDWKP